MNRLSKIISIVAMTLALQCSFAFAETLPMVDISGGKYYVYTVKKGDSLFAIARANGWDYDKLTALNPNAGSPLQKGLKIYYPAQEVNPESDVVPEVEMPASPLVHKIKRGETVYGISRMYGIPEETIYLLNPGSRKGIREGAELILQQGNISTESKDSNDSPEYYVIKRGDTLFGVARKYETTVVEIMKKNPGISEKNFQAGATIRLPQRGEGVKSSVREVTEEQLTSFTTYQVDKKDTWETISAKTGVDKEDLKSANKDAGEKPKNKSIIAVPNIETTIIEKEVIEDDPREFTEEGINEIYEDVHGISANASECGLKVALLLSEVNSRKDLEFSRGFLTAMRQLKDSGYRIDVNIVNGNRQNSEVLTELADMDADIIFLTTEKGIADSLAEFAEVSQTPMVNVFDVKSELYADNPYILQLLTPSTYFNDEIVARLCNDYSGAKLIMVGDDSSDQLGNLLKERWNGSDRAVMTPVQIASYNFNPSIRYLIYSYSTKKDAITELLNSVKKAKEDNLMSDISVLGRPGWIVYDEPEMEQKFFDCGVIIPSRFYYDRNSTDARKFEMYYKSLFDRQPTKSFPMYAVMGYDSALYFIEGLMQENGDVNMLKDSASGVQSDFSFRRPTNWSGPVNSLVYLVKFTPYNTIDKIKVK